MGNHRAGKRERSRSASTSAATPLLTQAYAGAGKRRATPARRHVGARGPLFAAPSAPTLVGAAALVLAAGGAVTLGGGSSTPVDFSQASASAPSSISAALADRQQAVSRDSRRQALADAADADLQDAVDAQSLERNAALQKFALSAESYADEIAKNLWVSPIPRGAYRLTARVGQFGLWSSSHTGLDFAAPYGTPILAIARGTVTETGYEGAYGNRTVITLEDGTELWFCHQASFGVSVGDEVVPGQQIGTVGNTGRSTGPHLHLEVRPGAGDPVDPYNALIAHGVTP